MRKQVTEYTCDVCSCEVDESILMPSLIKCKGFTDNFTNVEIDLNTNEADICIYCFIKAVNKLDTRPKAAN